MTGAIRLTLNKENTYTYTLQNGYKAELTGWTQTRNYAKGFLRNEPGSGHATVSGLIAGQVYSFAIYQYASQYQGQNNLKANGIDQGKTDATASDDATKTGTAIADGTGKIEFEFERNDRHVHLSGIAVGIKCEGTDACLLFSLYTCLSLEVSIQ